ncbi:MAG TPA: phosphate signaling complex protein PhoU [Trebonia sp.]|nr:phosphate signaling complex protein PhoU [Trebonia sp.]
MTESRREFERDLEAIEASVIQLFAMVEEGLDQARRALRDGDGDASAVLIARDREIDVLYRQVEELVQREILLQAPVAADLRFLLSVLRITPELERTHDLIVQVSASAGSVSLDDLSPSGQATVARMGDLASEMWGRASECWYQRDRSVAAALAEQDRELDDLHAQLLAELAAGGMAARATMEFTLVARCYERIGAHAVNVARRVIYLAGH